MQPLLELLKVGNPTNLTDEEIVRFREWLRAAYENAGPEIQEPAEITPLAPLTDEPIKTQPTWAHVDRVLQAILAFEGKARKQMARRARCPRRRMRIGVGQ